jgi:hypothetical protein
MSNQLHPSPRCLHRSGGTHHLGRICGVFAILALEADESRNSSWLWRWTRRTRAVMIRDGMLCPIVVWWMAIRYSSRRNFRQRLPCIRIYLHGQISIQVEFLITYAISMAVRTPHIGYPLEGRIEECSCFLRGGKRK